MEPTEEGKRRYDDIEPHGHYDGIPCTCKEKCKYPCKGECGCKACSMAYNDALSMPSD